MRVRLLCAGSALLGLVAACGGEADAPSTLPPVSVPPSTTTVVTSAPAVPSEAAVATPDGATAFARFFYQQVAKGFQTQNPELVRSISLPSCQSCTRYVESITSVKEDDLRVEGGDFTITFAAAPAFETPNTAVVEIGWDFAPVSYFDASGKQVRTGPAVTGVEESMTLQRRGDSWVVANLLEVRQRS